MNTTNGYRPGTPRVGRLPGTRSIRPFLVLLAMLFVAPGLADGQSLSNAVFQKHREGVERAVDRALAFLAETQGPDGTYRDSYGRSVGIVSLVGMAYLSAGHTPGHGPYADNIERCLDYVLAGQQPNGLLDRKDSGHGLMYAHNIATLFLSECSGMVSPEQQEAIDRVLPRATQLILSAQAIPKKENHRGGWRYKPTSTDSDRSCSGWALMALRSAKLNGAPVPDEAIALAVEYVFRNHDKEQGRFGYTDPWGNSETLTGCGLLCLELTGYHGTESTFRAGDYILESREEMLKSAHEFYGNYYNAQAMFQLGGRYWEEYADWMYGHYISQQQTNGAWSNGRNGSTYGTSMMVLSFTVPYRQLPIYQRDETVDEIE